MSHIPIRYDSSYLTPGMRPMPAFPRWTEGVETAQKLVNQYLESRRGEVAKEPPGGTLKHPYFVPGAHYHHLWDWDAYFMSEAAWTDEMAPYAEGSLRNLLGSVGSNGRPPKLIRGDGSLDMQHPIPLHAAWTVLICERRGDWSLAEEWWKTLLAIQNWHNHHTRLPSGLYFWLSMSGPGFDNHPGVYGRPPRTVAGVDLNSFHYREFRAWERLSSQLGRANPFEGESERLAEAIQLYLFDPVDRFYYNLDLCGDATQTTKQELTWPVHLKFRHIAGVMPLWAGLTGEAEAKSIIEEHMLNEEAFLAAGGIRSMSRKEPLYNNVPMANPSNWQGPIWVLSTALGIDALRNYGYEREAEDVAGRIVKLLAADIAANKTIHEFYHGDTGAPLLSPGFLSWNFLAYDLLRGGAV